MTYNVTDAFGFSASRTRTIIVRDTQKPVIKSLMSRDTVDHQLGNPYNDTKYIEITDNYWGISTYTRTGNVNVNQQGIYTLRYRTTDGSGNQSDEYVLRVFVRDTDPPHIELRGAPEVVVPVFGTFNDPGVYAFDAVSNVTVTDDKATALNLNRIGTYFITYTARDASGNSSSVQRMVRVVDKIAPVITLLGRNPFRIERTTPYTPQDPGYTVIDNYDNSADIRVEVDTSTLNVNVGGVYFVYYTAIDQSGNVSDRVFRQVEVYFGTGLKSVTHDDNVQIYPNPSHGNISVISTKVQKSIEVFDMTGKMVYNENVNGTMRTQIDLKNSGLYLLQIVYEDGTKSTHKIVIQ
jgi:hypothetical protein